MTFSDDTIGSAWARSGGHCQCVATDHAHAIPHGKHLIFTQRGKEGPGAWEAHHASPIGGDTLSNCQILCWECYQQSVG